MLLGACGITADFGGLQGGAAVDASAPDATTTHDAGDEAAPPEAGVGGETSSGFCGSLPVAPKLCADFDEGKPVDTGWTLRDATPHAIVAVDANGYSPPGSMQSAITPDDVPASARLQQAVPVLATHVHMELKMLLPTGGGPFELVALHEEAPDGKNYGFFYKQENGNLLVYVGSLHADGGLAQYVYPLGAPPATWLHVEIDIDIGDHGAVLVKHDGAIVVNETDVQTATDDRRQLFVELGFYSPDGATAHADFDDVVVDWE